LISRVAEFCMSGRRLIGEPGGEPCTPRGRSKHYSALRAERCRPWRAYALLHPRHTANAAREPPGRRVLHTSSAADAEESEAAARLTARFPIIALGPGSIRNLQSHRGLDPVRTGVLAGWRPHPGGELDCHRYADAGAKRQPPLIRWRCCRSPGICGPSCVGRLAPTCRRSRSGGLEPITSAISPWARSWSSLREPDSRRP
jgi:hypothetical protein